MDFTYVGYLELINLLKEKNYQFCNYFNYEDYDKSVILRHDIDNLLNKALEMARLEYENNIISTFFVLLSTDFYNVFSKKSNKILKEIISLGHHIGLHFDGNKYEILNAKELEYWVERESEILGYAIDKEIKVVSMHRPSKWIVENNIQFERIINSYSKKFLLDFKYLSDSRMHWREDVLGIIVNEKYNRLHILTHSFWYSHKNETINEKLMEFIDNAKIEQYYSLKDNIKDLDEIICKEDIL